MNRRQRIRYRFWRHAADPRLWAAAGACLLVVSSLLSCYAVYELKRSDCRQRTEGRAAARALAVAVVDEGREALAKAKAAVRREIPLRDCG